MCGKHERENTNDAEVNARSYHSSLWKQFVSLWPLLDKISKWEAGSGKWSNNQSLVRLLD